MEPVKSLAFKDALYVEQIYCEKFFRSKNLKVYHRKTPFI